jgi:hypothetical protein
LDIYHASEHLYAAAKALYGEGSVEVSAWVEARRQTLLRGGVAALEAELVAQEHGLRSASKRRALAELRDYLSRTAKVFSHRPATC